MIVTEVVKVKMNGKHIRKYLDKGYRAICGEIIDVKVEDLPKCSNVKVEAICDVCNKNKMVSYLGYNTSIKKGGFYACSQKCSNVKVVKTLEEKYGEGVTSPAKSKIVLDKMKSTCMERYGVEQPSKLNKFIEKAKSTKLERYGDVNYTNTNKNKETCMGRYGVDNVSKLDWVKEKKIETTLKNYGVDHPMKCRDIYLKSFKHKYYNGIYYQSSNELMFIKFCEKNNIEIVDPTFNIHYELQGKCSTYYPDFYLPKYNLVCEIKSTYTLNVDIDKNISKMFDTIDNGYNFLFIIDNNFDYILEKTHSIK